MLVLNLLESILFYFNSVFSPAVTIRTVVISMAHKDNCSSLISLKCESTCAPDDPGQLQTFSYIWFLHNETVREGEGSEFQIFTLPENLRESSEICCKVFSSGGKALIGESCLEHLIRTNDTNVNVDRVPNNHDFDIDMDADRVDSRSVIINWKILRSIKNSSLPIPIFSECIVQYKKWNNRGWENSTLKNATVPLNQGHQKEQGGIYIGGLKPWTKYHFRANLTTAQGQHFTSPDIVLVTSEDLPSASAEIISVSILDDSSLFLVWKPPPRSEWNGALLGYNIGYKKKLQQNEKNEDEEDNDEEQEQEDSFTFLMVTGSDLLGKRCEQVISVPDSSVPYILVVQPFNNVGVGPLSKEVITKPNN